MPAEGRENPLLKKGNSDAFFREKYLTKNTIYILLGTDLLIQFAETVNADLYILPNSINDIIVTPAIKELTDEDLNDMMAVIKVFNKPDQDSLSDNILKLRT